MNASIPLFLQSTDFTCGSSATLMVWKYFDSAVELSERNEFMIWSEIMGLPFKFSSPYRVAEFFLKKNFEVKLLMKQDIKNKETVLKCGRVNCDEQKLFVDFFIEHNKILKTRIASSILNKKPTIEDIKEALSNRIPAIALVDSYYMSMNKAGRTSSHLPHWIVITKYENKRFQINDPEKGRISIEEPFLRMAMNTYSKLGWPSALILVKSKS